MFKKLPLLRAPLSAALRGGGRHMSSATATPSLLRSAPRFNHSAALSSSTFYSTPSIIDFLGNIRFPGKRFCTGSAEKVAASCWSCHSPAETSPFLACSSCRCVQPVDCSVDYFRIYGLEKRFEIEDGNLEKKYKDWQKKLHPDLVHSKSEREREYAAEQSARVIDAYRTLSNPLLRAIYILRLEGVNVDEEETVSDPSLLLEILEIREAVEEAADSKTLHQIKFQIEEKLKQWSESFSNAFQSKRFEDAQKSIQRMTYYDRINEEIVKKL